MVFKFLFERPREFVKKQFILVSFRSVLIENLLDVRASLQQPTFSRYYRNNDHSNKEEMASKLLCVAASTSQHINAMANGQQQIFIFIQFCIGINCSQKT